MHRNRPRAARLAAPANPARPSPAPTGHGAHAGNGRRHGLHVVGPVFAFRPIRQCDGAAQDAGEHLAADEEADREIHKRARDSTQRTENQNGTQDSRTWYAGEPIRGRNRRSFGKAASRRWRGRCWEARPHAERLESTILATSTFRVLSCPSARKTRCSSHRGRAGRRRRVG